MFPSHYICAKTKGRFGGTEAMELCRAYLHGWKKREKPEEYICDFFFTSDIQKAAYWPTKAEADVECAFLDSRSIWIDLQNGGQHICRAFESEELANGQFAIKCNIPPVAIQARSTS